MIDGTYDKFPMEALLIGLDVAVFAVIGYLIGHIYDSEVYGTLIGAILGTLIMYIHFIIVLGRIKKTTSRVKPSSAQAFES